MTTRNFAIEIADDNVLLRFMAEDGREAIVNVAQLAEQLGGETRAVLLAWCEDRKRDALIPSALKPLLAQDYED